MGKGSIILFEQRPANGEFSEPIVSEEEDLTGKMNVRMWVQSRALTIWSAHLHKQLRGQSDPAEERREDPPPLPKAEQFQHIWESAKSKNHKLVQPGYTNQSHS